jgi:acyl-CoA synthetase (AMP-forming)/AMP-acid ligase II
MPGRLHRQLHIPDDAVIALVAYGRAVTSPDLQLGPAGGLTGSAQLASASITQRLVATATTFGGRPALVAKRPELPYSFADLASTVQHAAAGLAWRGLRPRDVVGVYVPDAASYVLACHSISAAGGIPSPVSAQLSIPDMASQLADCGARMLLTAPPLAAAALAAADRSWVRQVISFGDAPAATPFASLLKLGSLRPPSSRPHELALLPYVPGADGRPQPAGLTHLSMAAELSALSATADISTQDVVLATPPAGDGRSYGIFLDHVLLHGATVVAIRPEELAAAAGEHRATAAIIPIGLDVRAVRPLRLFAVPS